MKPIIKYRGGKSKEIPNFINYIPKQFDTYYEPFFWRWSRFLSH